MPPHALRQANTVSFALRPHRETVCRSGCSDLQWWRRRVKPKRLEHVSQAVTSESFFIHEGCDISARQLSSSGEGFCGRAGL
jgi:hypothetical protein